MPASLSRISAVVAGGALVLAALAACSGGDGTTSAGSDTGTSMTADGNDGAGADTGDGPDAPGAPSDDAGTVTVEIASGPHAGTHTRSGSLQCARVASDGIWLMFAPEQGEPDEIAHMGAYWLPEDVEDTSDTPYPDMHQLLELSFGSVLATGDNRITISADTGGELAFALPNLNDAGQPVYHLVGTTPDGAEIKISATPAECANY